MSHTSIQIDYDRMGLRGGERVATYGERGSGEWHTEVREDNFWTFTHYSGWEIDSQSTTTSPSVAALIRDSIKVTA